MENKKNELNLLLGALQNYLSKNNENVENDGDLKNSDKFIETLRKKEERKNYHEKDDQILENVAINNKNLSSNIEKNEKHIKDRKKYTKIPKSEKDIYSYLSPQGEKIGLFFGLQPNTVAKKVAKKIYLNTQKKNFDFKIYNKITDRIFSYKAEIIDVEKIKKVCGHIIPILHEIKVIRA